MNYNLIPSEQKETGVMVYRPRTRVSRFNKLLSVLLIFLIVFLLLGFSKRHGAQDVIEDELNRVEAVEVEPTEADTVEEQKTEANTGTLPSQNATAPTKAPAKPTTNTEPKETDSTSTTAPTTTAETNPAPTEAPTSPAPVAKAWIVSRSENAITVGFKADGNGLLTVNMGADYKMNTAQALNAMAVGYDNSGKTIAIKLIDIGSEGGTVRIEFLENIENANVQVSFRIG